MRRRILLPASQSIENRATHRAKARKGLRWLTAILIPTAVCCTTSQVLAFDYPEHAAISADALQASLRVAPPQGAVLESMVDALLAELPARATTCPPEDRFSVDKTACLSIADIPALSGDHSGSPLLLYWRWFDVCAASGDAPSGAYSGLDMAGRLSYSDRSPEAVPTGIPQTVATFAAFVHKSRFSFPNWPTQQAWTSDDDFTLQGIDSSYASLAIDGHSHFRPGVAGFDVAFAAQRARYSLPDDPKGARAHHPR